MRAEPKSVSHMREEDGKTDKEFKGDGQSLKEKDRRISAEGHYKILTFKIILHNEKKTWTTFFFKAIFSFLLVRIQPESSLLRHSDPSIVNGPDSKVTLPHNNNPDFLG